MVNSIANLRRPLVRSVAPRRRNLLRGLRPLSAGLLMLGLSVVGCSGPVTPTATSQASPGISGPTASAPSTLTDTTGNGGLVYHPPDDSWSPVVVGTASVKRPGDWAAADSDPDHIVVIPPTTDLGSQGPEVSLRFLAGESLADVVPPPGTAAPSTITVNGYQGWQADGNGLPPVSRYVALQLPDGVLFGQAYFGPDVDLRPFLDGMLSTAVSR